MTVWDLLSSCRRQWGLLLIGLVLTTGVGWWVKHVPGVYFAQTQVIFLAPTSTRFPNSLNTGSASLIMTAGIIEHEMTQGSTQNTTSSASVSLVDQGVNDGTMVRLPNIGGQWAYNYAQPVLDVQAAASTPEEVRRRMEELQQAIKMALDRRQDAAQVDQFNRITVQASPVAVDVVYRGGDRGRALIVTTIVGGGVTLSVVVLAERRRLALQGIYVSSGRRSKFETGRPVTPRVLARSAPGSIREH